jgi:hypothetical protein
VLLDCGDRYGRHNQEKRSGYSGKRE